MKKVLLFMFLCFIISPYLIFAADTGKISGKVTDSSTGESLIGANIVIEGTFMGAATGMDGSYFILNIPPGKYNVRAEVIGYKILLQQNVQVMADLTTKIDFALEQTVLEGEQVVVEAKRPIIQPDLTASRSIRTAEDIQTIPIDDIEDIVGLSAGFVDGHARGGRMDEVLYLLNGMPVTDPMGQGDLGDSEVEIDIPELSIAEVNITTGGFSAEYGNAQSGIVDVITKQGGANYSGQMRYKTSALGFKPFQDHHELRDLEFSLGGPLPLSFLNSRFFIGGQYSDDKGRFDNQDDIAFSINSSLTFQPTKRDKFVFNLMSSRSDRGEYGHRWSGTTYENEDTDNDGYLDRTISFVSGGVWDYVQENNLDWDNIFTQMGGDTTTKRWVLLDLDGDGDFIDEDLNANGILDIVDLNHDGDSTDSFSMLDHLRDRDERANQIQGKWTHFLNDKSYFEIQLSRFSTYMKYNIKEMINEDVNNNGVLDPGEDLNGNDKLDPVDIDLFVDENNNDFIDASEDAYPDDPSKWMPWEDCPFGNAQDKNKFYAYGAGTTFWRLRWNVDQKITWTFKSTYTNQVNNNHKIRFGFEFLQYDIFDHDVDLASGGNVYGQNLGYRKEWGQDRKFDDEKQEWVKTRQEPIRPRSFAFFGEDKMEYKGMIVNFGLRFDYFDPNWGLVPTDMENPVTEVTTGGEVKDPVSAAKKFYWSPRLGIAHPITDRDVFYFNYGQYFQIPSFFKLYRNVNWDFSGAFPMVGNANLNPEITTSYEVGLRHQIGNDMRVEVKGFQKDIQGLTDTRQVFYTAANYYTYYYNIDYGNVRGFEIDLYKRIDRYFGGNINYTYSIARGKSSSSRQNYDLTWAGQIIPHHESYLDWDQRHTVNATLKAIIPVIDTHLDLTMQYGSGLPYSPAARTLEILINTERCPSKFVSNLMVSKRFQIGSRVKASVFLWVNNLFDNMNMNGMNDEAWFHLYKQIQEKYDEKDGRFFGAETGNLSSNSIDDDGDGYIDESIRDEYMMLMDTNGDGKVDWNKKNSAGGIYGIPGWYNEGRVVRLGVSFEF